MKLYVNPSHSGFTLIELMITIVIAAILVAMAVPSFRELTQNNRMVSSTNEFVTSMNLARSAAVKFGKDVYVSSTGGTSDWSSGWSVWVDLDDSGTFNVANDQQLRSVAGITGDITVDSAINAVYQYIADGSLNIAAADTVTICDSSRSNETPRMLFIAATGRVSLDTTNGICP